MIEPDRSKRVDFHNPSIHPSSFLSFLMVSRESSRSSLLGPPRTVGADDDDEDDDNDNDNDNSVVGNLPTNTQDDNRIGWGYRSNSSRRADEEALMAELADFSSVSPPIARTIHDFNQELDALMNSFDTFFERNKKDRRTLETTTTASSNAHPRPQYAFMSGMKRMTPTRKPEAPSSRDQNSTLKHHPTTHSTPARRYTTTMGGSHYTPSEPPPPAPVETPGYGFPTPNRHRTRHTTVPPPTRVPDTSNASTTFPDPTPPPPPPAASSSRRSTQKHTTDDIEDLYRTIREQEIRIQDLEIENEILRKKLSLQPPIIQRIHRTSPAKSEERPIPVRFDPVVNGRHDRSSDVSLHREEPDGRRYPSSMGTVPEDHTPSPYRTQASYLSTPSRRVVDRPPRHIETTSTTSEDRAEGLTPGTRFVAELALLMKIENAHYVPLSMIVDKHWDRLQHHFRNQNRLQE